MFPNENIVVQQKHASADGDNVGTCGSGLGIQNSGSDDDPTMYITVAQYPSPFTMVDGISVSGKIQNISLAVASRANGEFVELITLMGCEKTRADIILPIEVHTVRLKASERIRDGYEFKIEINGCIINGKYFVILPVHDNHMCNEFNFSEITIGN